MYFYLLNLLKISIEFYLIRHLERTSKSHLELQDYFVTFMLLHMIFLSFVISKTCGRAASGANM